LAASQMKNIGILNKADYFAEKRFNTLQKQLKLMLNLDSSKKESEIKDDTILVDDDTTPIENPSKSPHKRKFNDPDILSEEEGTGPVGRHSKMNETQQLFL
jgi:hypothetical protein